MNNLIGITGRKRAGKDTVANMLKDNDTQIISFADPMREIMKEVCIPGDLEVGPVGMLWHYFDYEKQKEEECLFIDEWNGSFFGPYLTKLMSYGATTVEEVSANGNAFLEFLQQFMGRIFSPREFLQKLGTEFAREQLGENVWVDMLMRDLEEGKSYIVPDVRFDNEAEAIRNNGGRIIEVIRENHPDGEVKDGHSSENGITPHEDDITITALDKSELRRKVLEIKELL